MIVDHTVKTSVSLLRSFCQEAYFLHEFAPAKTLARTEIAHLCQQKRGLLLTDDPEYFLLLQSEHKEPWGLVLLPTMQASQHEVLNQLARGELACRPSMAQSIMVEVIRRNRFLVDLRQDPPSICILCNGRWLNRRTHLKRQLRPIQKEALEID